MSGNPKGCKRVAGGRSLRRPPVSRKNGRTPAGCQRLVSTLYLDLEVPPKNDFLAPLAGCRSTLSNFPVVCAGGSDHRLLSGTAPRCLRREAAGKRVARCETSGTRRLTFWRIEDAPESVKNVLSRLTARARSLPPPPDVSRLATLLLPLRGSTRSNFQGHSRDG